jgi:hypothetical protein
MAGFVFITSEGKHRVLMPNGDIYVAYRKTGEPKKVKYVWDGDGWLTPKQKKPAKIGKKTQTKLKKELKKLQAGEKVKKPPKTPKVKKTPKIKKTPKVTEPQEPPIAKEKEVTKPVSKQGKVKGLTKLELPNGQLLCTFKGKTFFISKSTVNPKYWLLSVETNDGKRKGISGDFTSIDQACRYFVEMVSRELGEKDRVNNRRGGSVQWKRKWKDRDRIVCDLDGRYYIGTIVSIHLLELRVIFDFDREVLKESYPQYSQEAFQFKPGDPKVIGLGIAKVREQPIPYKELENWVIKEEAKEKVYSYKLKEGFNLTFPVEEEFNSFLKKIPKFINDKYMLKMVQEYLLDHTLIIGDDDQMGDTGGKYWSTLNEVTLHYKYIVDSNKYSAMVLLHEVLHYKMFPVKKQLKTWLKKNILSFLGLEKFKNDNSVKAWYKAFLSDYYRQDTHEATKRLRKYACVVGADFDHMYGLVQFFEAPSVFLSLKATGLLSEVSYWQVIHDELYKKFKKQIMK